MRLRLFSCITCVLVPSVYSLQANYWYNTDGGFLNSCGSQPCGTCNPGYYRSGCGNSVTGSSSSLLGYADPGTCMQCTMKPSFSNYKSTYPASGTFQNADCPFDCYTGYSLNSAGNGCVQNQCTPLTDITKEFAPGTSPNTVPACEFRCKAGYYGSVASNPTTCTPCASGTSSAAGATACSPCSAGSFSSSTGSASCSTCLPSGGVNTYTDQPGMSACVPCTTCANGKWKSGCGGNSAGSCNTCIN